jgi:glycerophosphoryl diester phosphodiesterase
MTTPRKLPLRRRAFTGLALIATALLLYYGVQAVLRTPPLTPLQSIAHRGGAKYAPENTLAAFQMASDQEVGWLELDVQMSKDGVLVVLHDDTVERTTNGSGVVRELTLEQLRSLDAGHGEKVPTFAEVVALAKSRGVKLLPEIKFAQLYPGLEEKVLDILEQANYLDQSVIQSFEADALEQLHRLEPRANLCALYGLWQFNVSRPAGNAQYVCPMAEMVLLNPGMIRQAHRQGRQVFIWFGVVENPFMVRVMRFFGADGLIVNDLLVLKR